VLAKLLDRPIVFSERTIEEDKQAMMRWGVPEPIAAMNAHAVSHDRRGHAAGYPRTCRRSSAGRPNISRGSPRPWAAFLLSLQPRSAL